MGRCIEVRAMFQSAYAPDSETVSHRDVARDRGGTGLSSASQEGCCGSHGREVSLTRPPFHRSPRLANRWLSKS